MKETRYTATIAFNVFAENDQKAIKIIQKAVNKINQNNARVIEIEHNPFASLIQRKITN